MELPARAVTPCHCCLSTARRHPPEHNPMHTSGGMASSRSGAVLGIHWDPQRGIHWEPGTGSTGDAVLWGRLLVSAGGWPLGRAGLGERVLV